MDAFDIDYGVWRWVLCVTWVWLEWGVGSEECREREGGEEGEGLCGFMISWLAGTDGGFFLVIRIWDEGKG